MLHTKDTATDPSQLFAQVVWPSVIVNVSPACGCTASDFTKTLAPGAEGIVKLTVKTAGMSGWTERYADVISNDKTQPNLKLWVKMDVFKGDTQAVKN